MIWVIAGIWGPLGLPGLRFIVYSVPPSLAFFLLTIDEPRLVAVPFSTTCPLTTIYADTTVCFQFTGVV